MTLIKKVYTHIKQNWMDNLKNVIKAMINYFIYCMEAKTDGIEEKLKGNIEYLNKGREGKSCCKKGFLMRKGSKGNS